jgi:uncharacterized protein (DUF1330 family)|tara:strand:- start:293 stop:577 length:285 start_codon:yes stop_codon:yes gene_type:complete
MKAYWIARINILDTAKLEAYLPLSAKAIAKYGGKYLARGGKNISKEGPSYVRTVVVEYPSFDQAHAAYESDEYKIAREILGDGVDRIFVIVEGV